MSYVGLPFTHDVFVSYSHGDVDGSDDSRLKRWSQAFVRELESELRAEKRFGKTLSLFLDQDHRPGQGIDPMEPLSDQLRKQIGDSALVTILMSPYYLTSKWCTDERDWWYARQSEQAFPAEGRIAVARIWHATDPWPAPLADQYGEQLVGFRFYDPKKPPHPYEWPAPGPDSKGPFREALLDLVGSLWLKLDEIKARLDERRRTEQEAAKLAGEGQSIYLHGRADQAKAWERAHAVLSDSGFAVVPGEPDQVEGDPKRLQSIRQQRIETLSACDALLLVGTDDGRALDADLVVVGRQDRHSARAATNRLLPCGLLDTVGGPVATAQRRAAARALQVEWIDTTREPWTPEVQRWLVGKSAALQGAP